MVGITRYRSMLRTLPVTLLVTTLFSFSLVTPAKAVTSVPCSISGHIRIVQAELFDSPGCTGSVVVPDDVTIIKQDSFPEGTALTSITIPASVTSIANFEFSGLTSLTNVTVSADNPNYSSIAGVLFDKNATTLINYPAGSTDTSYATPLGVTTIGVYAFNRARLTSLTLPPGLEYIESGAFRATRSLTSIQIPESVKAIGGGAFEGATALTSITIPSEVKVIGERTFSFATSLTSITLPPGLERIDKEAFQYARSLTSITIPSSVTHIGANAFEHTRSLTTITLSSGLTHIGAYAFWHTTSLTDVTIPATVTEIGRSAFENSGITSVVFANGIQIREIAAYLFYYTPRLASIAIPSGVTSIGNSALSYSSINSATIPASVTSIAETVFNNSTSLTSITVDSQSSSYSSISGVLYDKTAATLVRYPSGRIVSNWTIPESVTSIWNFAFHGTSSLTSISIPTGVTSIGFFAFGFCTALTSVTFPSTLTTIGRYAFANTTALASISIPSSVTSIGEAAFTHMSSLTSVNFEEGSRLTTLENHLFYEAISLTSINIPASVTSIREHVFFENRTLPTISIPASVTSIGMSAFDGASALTSITIPAGVTSIAHRAFAKTSITSITIPDGVTSIGHGAFSSANQLTSITIPASVTRIDDFAFSITSSLIKVNFLGNAPTTSSTAFANGHRGLKAYIGPNATGFSAPGARWNGLVVVGANSNVITYWSNRGAFPTDFNFIAVEEFVAGSQITAPTPPTRQGFTFAGWLDSDTSSRIQFPFIPNIPVDKTLFALWDAIPTTQPSSNPVAAPPSQVPRVDSGSPSDNVESITRIPGPSSPMQASDAIKESQLTIGVNQTQGSRKLAARLGVKTVSSKAKVNFTIAKSSQKICRKSGTMLKTLKAGNCIVTLTVQEPKTKKGKKPKAIKVKTSLVVQ